MLYASTGSMRCFECDDVGHKRNACSHKATDQHTYDGGAAASAATEAASQPVHSTDLTNAGAGQASSL